MKDIFNNSFELDNIILKSTYYSGIQSDEYISNFKNNIVINEIHPDIKYGWIMPNGDIIGYIGEYDNRTCFHLALAAVLCYCSDNYDWNITKHNPYQYIEELNGLKFSTEYAMLTNKIRLTPVQENMFIEWLIKVNIPYIRLGSSKQYTIYNIKQMDNIMLSFHLSNS